jgi:prophage regulatory protein
MWLCTFSFPDLGFLHSPTTSNFNLRGAIMAKTIQTKPNLTILRRKQVEEKTGLSRSTIYLRIQEGTFPRQLSLGARAVGWVESEIEDWLTAKLDNRDNT